MRTRTAATTALIAASIAAATLSGCAATPAGPASDRVVSIAVEEPREPLVPASGDDPGAALILPALYSGLVAYGPEGEVMLDVAESITTDDNIEFTVSISPDARFSDGSPVTSSSFVDAWRLTARQGDEWTTREPFAGFRGYDPDGDVDLVESGALEIVDETTFLVRLTRPDPELPRRLGIPAFYPLPEQAFAEPAAYLRVPVGNGPYRLAGDDAWRSGDRLALVPNERYAGPRRPRNAGLSFRFFDHPDAGYADLVAGELDVVARIPDSDRDTAGARLDGRVRVAPLPELAYLAFPRGLPGFAGEAGDQRRRALSLAIQRDAIAESYDGRLAAAASFVPVAVDAETPSASEGLRTNWQIADGLWREADRETSVVEELTIAYVAGTDDARAMTALIANIEDALHVEVNGIEYPDADALGAALADDSLAGPYLVHASVSSPASRPFLQPGGTVVPTGFGGTTYADHLTAAAETADAEIAQQMLREAQARLFDRFPVIPLWSPTVATGFGAGVADVRLGWNGVPLYADIVPVER